MPGKWRHWTDIEKTSGWNGPAIYRVRMLAGGRPVSIPRFLAKDRSGIVSIGMTGRMEERRRQFLSGFRRGRGHSEANLLHLLLKHTSLQRSFGRFELQYRFKSVSSRVAATTAEAKELIRYVKRYGEVPPLNSALPGRYSRKW